MALRKARRECARVIDDGKDWSNSGWVLRKGNRIFQRFSTGGMAAWKIQRASHVTRLGLRFDQTMLPAQQQHSTQPGNHSEYGSARHGHGIVMEDMEAIKQCIFEKLQRRLIETEQDSIGKGITTENTGRYDWCSRYG